MNKIQSILPQLRDRVISRQQWQAKRQQDVARFRHQRQGFCETQNDVGHYQDDQKQVKQMFLIFKPFLYVLKKLH